MEKNKRNMEKLSLHVVAAISKDNVIGYRDIAKNEFKLPWRIPLDQKQFQDLTTFIPVNQTKLWNVVIMGRHTWESLPKSPLQGRVNIIITKAENVFSSKIEHCKSVIDLSDEDAKTVLTKGKAFTAPTLPSAMEFLARKLFPIHKAFIIGGHFLYAEAMSRKDCASLQLTRIDKNVRQEQKDDKDKNKTWVVFPPIPQDFKLRQNTPQVQVIEMLSNEVLTMTNETWTRDHAEADIETKEKEKEKA